MLGLDVKDLSIGVGICTSFLSPRTVTTNGVLKIAMAAGVAAGQRCPRWTSLTFFRVSQSPLGPRPRYRRRSASPHG